MNDLHRTVCTLDASDLASTPRSTLWTVMYAHHFYEHREDMANARMMTIMMVMFTAYTALTTGLRDLLTWVLVGCALIFSLRWQQTRNVMIDCKRNWDSLMEAAREGSE